MNDVLVVDDEKSIRITLKAFLEDAGYNVSIAKDADQAKRLLETNRFGIVVTDIILPKITGVELLKYIKNIASDVEVIMMTGEPTVETATESLRMGAFDYLYKPITKNAVLKTVQKALYVKQLTDEKKRLEKENKEYQANLEQMVHEKTRALQDSMALNNQIISNSKDVIVLLDIEGRILFINPGGCEALGIDDPAEYNRTFWQRFWDDKAISSLASAIENAMAGKLGKFQGVSIPINGPRRYWDANVTPIVDKDSNISRLLCICRDLTETIEMEEKIRSIQQDWKNIFQATPHPMAVVDTSHTIIHANTALVQKSGIPENVLAGTKCHHVFYSSCQDHSSRQCPLLEDEKQGKSKPVVEERVCFDGIYLLTCTPVLDEKGGTKKIIQVATDITELKKITKAHENLAMAMTLSSEAVAVLDAETVFQYVNPAFLSMFSVCSETLLLKNIFDTDILDSAFPLGDRISTAVRTGRGWSGNLMIRHGDAERYYGVYISPSRDDFGKISAYLLIFNDKTELMEMEEQVRQTQKLESIGRLAGGVAHDFNNMLSPIIGFSEIALESIPDNHPLIDDLMEIRNAGKRAAALTRQLLAFSRKQILSMRTVDLNKEIMDLHKMLARLIGEDIQVDLSLDEAPCTVSADPIQFQQILMNLVVNARDAMPDGGVILIGTKRVFLDPMMQVSETGGREDMYVELMVEDSGSGMSEAVIEKLFEPFFTTKDRDKGTGLGLSTVYGIVKQHQGHIRVESQPGKGTVFWIYLKYQMLETDDTGSEFTISELKGAATVLIVEDDTGVLKFVKSSLKQDGFMILSATTPLEALEIADRYDKRIDLLLTDVILPTMDGKQLVEEIKKTIPDIKVIFMSGYSDDIIAGHDLLDKEIILLNKPFSVSQLRQTVKRKIS